MLKNKNIKKFITGSSYAGSIKGQKNFMNDFGRYKYPDGATFNGYFVNGQFHGFGVLELPWPYNIMFKGTFFEGHIETAEDIVFSDDLHFIGEFGKNTVKCDEWPYLTKDNRYYIDELKPKTDIIESPDKLCASNTSINYETMNCYNIGYGLYNPRTHFTQDGRAPFQQPRYINCKEELNWIERNCFQQSNKIELPSQNICKNILKLNMQEMNVQTNNSEFCKDLPNAQVNSDKTYLSDMCSSEYASSTSESSPLSLKPSSSSISNVAQLPHTKNKFPWYFKTVANKVFSSSSSSVYSETSEYSTTLESDL